MSFGNIVGGLIQKGMASQSHDRLRTGAETADRGGGVERMLDSLMHGQGGRGEAGSQDIMRMAQDFLRRKQAGGLTGAKIGGLGAVAGVLMGGGLGGAAKGGAMAVLGTLALKAWREHQAASSGVSQDAEPSRARTRSRR